MGFYDGGDELIIDVHVIAFVIMLLRALCLSWRFLDADCSFDHLIQMADARCEKRHDDVDFSWGSKEGRRHTIGTKEGVAERDMKFYESFTYEGVEYHLYDSVYLSGGTEVEPYIGKLIQIYELPNKAREVKLLWFFHPSEISNFLRSGNVLKNEIFLATGCGKGLANVNPLVKLLRLYSGFH